MNKSESWVENADVHLTRSIQVQGLKYGGRKTIQLSKICDRKDDIAAQMSDFFDFKGYNMIMNPIDSLVRNTNQTKEEVWDGIEILGSDSLLSALISKDKDTSLYRHILKLNKYKVKYYLASRIDGSYCGFQKLTLIAAPSLLDSMQLGLTWDESNSYGRLDSSQLDGVALEKNQKPSMITSYFVPYDFYFHKNDEVELEVVLNGPSGERVFPLKYDGG